MRFSVTHRFAFLMTCLDIRMRRRLALRPFFAGFGALSILALNLSLQRASHEANTLSLRGLITRWAGTRSVMSLGRPTSGSGSGAGAGAGPGAGAGGVGGVGATGSFSLRFQ